MAAPHGLVTLLACPLCGRPLDVRVSKKGKPYVVCDDCGLQLFVRGANGVARLRETTRTRVHVTGSAAGLASAQRAGRVASASPVSVLTGRGNA